MIEHCDSCWHSGGLGHGRRRMLLRGATCLLWLSVGLRSLKVSWVGAGCITCFTSIIRTTSCSFQSNDYNHYMNRIAISIVLTAFLAIAVFGFATTGTHDINSHRDCIATMGQAVLCSHNNAITMAQQHAQFFQKMTSAASLSFFLILLLFTLSARLNRKRLYTVDQQKVIAIKRGLIEIFYVLYRRLLLKWLTVSGKTTSATA